MPPCIDLYVWVRPGDRAATLSSFIQEQVDLERPGEPRFPAFLRTFVTEEPDPGDAEILSELRRAANAGVGYSIYLRGARHHEVILTITEEGNLVLGLGLDDPSNDPRVADAAEAVLAGLMKEFDGVAGIGGWELPPPQSVTEWRDDGLVAFRIGSL